MEFKVGEYVRVKIEKQLLKEDMIKDNELLTRPQLIWEKDRSHCIVPVMFGYFGKIAKIVTKVPPVKTVRGYETKYYLNGAELSVYWLENWLLKLSEEEQKICKILYEGDNE